jgi:hypothetical protein
MPRHAIDFGAVSMCTECVMIAVALDCEVGAVVAASDRDTVTFKAAPPRHELRGKCERV